MVQYRQAFAEAILELASVFDRVMLVESDIASPARKEFRDKYPTRFIDTGIAEANAVGICSGLASEGMKPYWYTYGFLVGRAYDQIRQSIAQNKTNVKIIGYNCGVSGIGGASHNCVDDIGLMRMIPEMTVVAPADAYETHRSIIKSNECEGPVYIRFPRGESFDVAKYTHFEFGRATIMREGEDVTIVCNGPMVYESLKAQELMPEIHAEIINMSTVKPLDTITLLKSVKKTGKIIIAEEHSVIGGLGEAVCSSLSSSCINACRRIGVEDIFTQSGKGDLKDKYGLTAKYIAKACESVMRDKK